jgi:CheY-like chemotaxis protein
MVTATRRPVVLLVEDELLIRMQAAEMIGESGFKVVEASNADESVAMLETRLDIAVAETARTEICSDSRLAHKEPQSGKF